MIYFYALLNVLTIVSSFFILSSRRVPELRKHSFIALFFRVFIISILNVGLAWLFDVPIVIFREHLSAEQVVQTGIPVGVIAIFCAFSGVIINRLRWRGKNSDDDVKP